MSAEDASVDLAFGDGEYTFRLGLGQWRELQEKINGARVNLGAPMIGPYTLLQILQARDAWIDEVREVIRLGLIGGGMAPIPALALVKRYVDGRPLVEAMPVAQMVVLAALAGVPHDPVGVGKKKPTRVRKTKAATATPSDSQSSTARAPL